LSLAASGRLSELDSLDWDERPAVCVVMAAEGYPDTYTKGKEISGLHDAAAITGAKVFHAGTTTKDMKVLTNGGRVLGVTAIGETLADAKARAYAAVEQISWQGGWCRSDISDKA